MNATQFLFLFWACFILLSPIIYKKIRRNIRMEEYTKPYLINKKWVSKEGIEKYFGFMIINDKNIILLFDAANINNKFIRQYYMLLKIGVFVFSIISLLALVYVKQLSMVLVVIGGCVLMIVCVIVPDRFLESRKNTNIVNIANDLPLLTDAMIVCMKTGMTIEMTVVYLERVIEQISPPLKLLLRQIKKNMPVQGVADSVETAKEMFQSDDMDMFSMTLVQSLTFGSSIVPKLSRLSEEIRVNSILRTEEKINKLSAKMSAPLIVFIMIPVVIIIVAPSIMRIMG